MAIKMRNNTKRDAVCCECAKARKQVLDMFDVCVGGNIFTICDACNDALFYKTLRANCYVNGRVKSKEDIAIINQRGRDKDLSKIKETKEPIKYKKEETEEIERKSSFFNGEE